jgi:uroporphyrinogen III methyltransferase/synthase
MTQPLTNKTILVTRDVNQSLELIRKIEDLGGKVVSLPTIYITEPDDWNECDRVMNRINEFHWIIFTSINGVRNFFKRINERNVIEYRGKFAVIGEKTLKALQSYKHQADIVPGKYNSSELLRAFKEIDLTNKQILIPTSNIARDELQNGLEERGAAVTRLTVYQTKCREAILSADLIEHFNLDRINVVLFFSPSAFNCFVHLFGNQIAEKIIKYKVAIAAIGPTTKEAIEDVGVQVDIVPEQSTEESMIAALKEYFKRIIETEPN